MSTFRRFIKGDSSGNIVEVNLQDIDHNVKDYHIVLTFATDYDDQGNHSNGGFTFNGDLQNIIQALSKFESENRNVNIKLFISIGGHDSKFPFKANDSWVSWDTDLLKILFGYLKDLRGIEIGIDVYYEYISTKADVFASCVGELIKNLKNDKVITVASIAPSAATEKEYTALFQKYGNSIHWVVYQFYTDPILTPVQFITRYKSLPFPKAKLLAGYSTKKDDWKNIKPIVFYKGIISLLKDKQAPGASIWDVDELVSNGWAILPFGVVLAP